MKKIISLSRTSFDHIFISFKEAFADYEMQLTKEELQAMLIRRGFQKNLSYGAFIDNKLVAFTLNGIGSFNGVSTAYDTGTGTIKEYRGQGLATEIFNYSIPFLKEAGINQYLLEVLQHNTKAISIYKKLGFKVVREFNYFSQDSKLLSTKQKTNIKDITYKEIDLNLVIKCSEFWDFYPSWQNDTNSISRSIDNFIIVGAFLKSNLVGYCILEKSSGDISHIAVDKKYRRKGIGTHLLTHILSYNNHSSVKSINTDTNCDSITGFFESINLSKQGKQFEMIRKLS